MGRLIQRAWLNGPDLYGDETCTECGVLYRGKRAKRIHRDWHAQLDEDINGMPEPVDPGGYILPDDSITTGYPVIEAFPAEKDGK
jgi:hypothetical protein